MVQLHAHALGGGLTQASARLCGLCAMRRLLERPHRERANEGRGRAPRADQLARTQVERRAVQRAHDGAVLDGALVERRADVWAHVGRSERLAALVRRDQDVLARTKDRLQRGGLEVLGLANRLPQDGEAETRVSARHLSLGALDGCRRCPDTSSAPHGSAPRRYDGRSCNRTHRPHVLGGKVGRAHAARHLDGGRAALDRRGGLEAEESACQVTFATQHGKHYVRSSSAMGCRRGQRRQARSERDAQVAAASILFEICEINAERMGEGVGRFKVVCWGLALARLSLHVSATFLSFFCTT